MMQKRIDDPELFHHKNLEMKLPGPEDKYHIEFFDETKMTLHIRAPPTQVGIPPSGPPVSAEKPIGHSRSVCRWGMI